MRLHLTMLLSCRMTRKSFVSRWLPLLGPCPVHFATPLTVQLLDHPPCSTIPTGTLLLASCQLSFLPTGIPIPADSCLSPYLLELPSSRTSPQPQLPVPQPPDKIDSLSPSHRSPVLLFVWGPQLQTNWCHPWSPCFGLKAGLLWWRRPW